ncbi:acyltransferase domain-containing protein [Streptomyces durbertensis]|uniref:Acyltransferase domain-containing protein n=1 Tax=Streptomyces durbertensis TaxID=2448886 RepID=A0ABR6EAV0_9ACTN|nr:acyltransferase domain-containing protein [Streptomyces durbertensis]MBB1242207.1 acyltransferase domain-containing protein [Streptomyces durbertensis]
MPAPPPDHRAAVHREWLLDWLARHLGRSAAEDEPLYECELDSVAALSLCGDVEQEFGPLLEPGDVWSCRTVRDLAALMCDRDERRGGPRPPQAAFFFSGQGGGRPRTTRNLYRHSHGYRRHLHAVDDVLSPLVGASVVAAVAGDRTGSTGSAGTALDQAASFAVGYALARTLEESGVAPVAVLGHGLGEIAAAAFAGALTLPDASRLVALRGALTERLVPAGHGGMTATCVSGRDTATLLEGEPEVTVAVLNASRSTVLAGPVEALERVEGRLSRRGSRHRRLPVRYAFQSPLLAPVADELRSAVEPLPALRPRLPFYSTVRGRLHDEPPTTAYWAEQLVSPVLFADAVRALLVQRRPTHVVELGPGTVLTPYVRGLGGPVCVAACRGPRSNAVDLAGVVAALDAGPLSEQLAGA